MIIDPRLCPDDPLDRGLVGEWRFDRNTGSILPDYSGYGNHGTLENGSQWAATRYGPALDFDGTDDLVACSHSDVFLPPNDMSVELIFKLDVLPSVRSEDAYLVKKGSYTVYVWSGNDRLYFAWKNSAATTFNANTITILSTGMWYHAICVKRDGVENKIYLDAIDQANWYSGPTSGTILQSTDNLNFGANWAGGQRTDGQIALVRIYNYALTQSEIRLRYQQCLARASGIARVWTIPFLSVAEAAADAMPMAMDNYRRSRV